MHLLAENHEALRLATSSETLLNASLESFAVRLESHRLVAEVVFRLRHSKRVKRLLLRFQDVAAFQFAHSQGYTFYNVESFKFLPVPNGYYLSLDPVDESDHADERDGDTIRADSVQAYELSESDSN